ncbi:formate dehydrogenase subunit delta [Novosphingobium sp.]|uniref:formate dehydrogenase subunit delta n=1 Tax=Novosphingobium sp. TaxID=1874826 RepID=UPI0025D1863F|nr:formate dehydrogenase subunit delta [Novosphingobium sp.]
MSVGTPERLAYMANQIATNLALTNDPVAATAEHIHSFWTPAMQRTLASEALDRLGPVARAAMIQLDADAG